MAHAGGRPKKYTTVKQMQDMIDKYFTECDNGVKIRDKDNGRSIITYKPYTVTGLCMFLNINRDTLCEYEKQEQFSDTIKRAKQKIENWIEEHSLMGDTNPTVSIFNLKNNFGWKDKQEVDIGNADDKPFMTDVSGLGTDDLVKLKEILAKTQESK